MNPRHLSITGALLLCLAFVILVSPGVSLPDRTPVPAQMDSTAMSSPVEQLPGHCTVFYASDDEVALGGNNEDCVNPRTKIWFLPAEEGRYGVAVVGYEDMVWQGAVNDHGLFFDGLAVKLVAIPQEGKPIYPGNLAVKAMTECATVDCVLQLYDRYSRGSDTWNGQILFGDSAGNSAIIEPLTTVRKESQYQVATNFFQSEVKPEHRTDPRYSTAMGMLHNSDRFSVDLFRRTLDATHQEAGAQTLYSTIYDLKQGLIYLYFFHDFDHVVVLNLKEELAKGVHTYDIPSLFPPSPAADALGKSITDRVTQRQAALGRAQVSPERLSTYAGSYGAVPDQYLLVKSEGDRIFMRTPSLPWVELIPVSDIRFAQVFSDGEGNLSEVGFTFQLEDGRVTGVEFDDGMGHKSIGPKMAQPVAASPNPTALPTATAPKSTIDLQPCRLGGSPAECGTLRVYENRAAQSGRMIDLRVAVIRATSSTPALDPIFYLAGGPGAAATQDAASGPQFPDSLARNHDLVFVDQRGTGASNNVLVPSDQPDLSGLTPEEIDAKAKEWVAHVLTEIDMDPRFYTTSVAMDDLDQVRQALGYDKIDVVGYSYGATAAQYYLRQHEEHVRTVTLGVGSLLDIPVFERWAQNSQRALDLIFDRCQAEPACHSAYPNVRQEFAELMARLTKEPVTEEFTNPSDGKPTSVTFYPDFFAATLRTIMTYSADHRELPRLIHRAYEKNDWSGITALYASGKGPEWWGNQIMARVIRCDEKWASFRPEEIARLGQGSYFKGRDVSLATEQALNCSYMPRGETPEGMTPQPGSLVPVLIWNGEGDPIDPPENMVGAQALFPNSISLVAPYQSHRQWGPDTVACHWSILAEFVESGSAQGLHTDCLKNINPLPFYTFD